MDSSALAFFPLIPGGKTPAIAKWEQTTPGSYPPVGNHGRALTPRDLVFDCDPRNYPAGRDVLKEIMELHRLPQTRVVRTPRGGFHLYFTKNPALKLRKKQNAFPGIDFLSDGHYTVQPGSVLAPDGDFPGGKYETVMDYEPAELPASLITVLEQYAEAIEIGTEISLAHFEQFKAECEIASAAIQGQHGSDTTYALALRGRDLALPRDSVYQLMRDYWNPRCLPPWEDDELYKVVTNAYRYARNAVGAATPEAKFLAAHNDNVIKIETYQNDVMVQGIHSDTLELTKQGAIKNTLGNVVYLLRQDPAWRGRLRYNCFSGDYEFTGRPDWRKDKLNEGLEITEHDRSCMMAWFSSAGHIKLEVASDKLKAAIRASSTPYHPVKDYLDALVWDGVPRIDNLFIDTMGCTKQPAAYVQAVSRCFALSCVKRIYEPGCKHDYVPVLEGVQGKRKSMWVQVWGGDWYSASELVRGDKDTYQNLRGRWIVELPEINATFTKADFAWLKGIITNPVDHYRASYGDKARGVPRESVFIGSINPNGSGEYLKDDENRRYWPLVTGAIDIEKLSVNRDQYFAEAVHRYRQGEKNWIDNDAVAELVRAEQEQRREKDGFIETLGDWLVKREASGLYSNDEIYPSDAYTACGFNSAREITSSQTRVKVANALRRLGYTHVAGRGAGVWKKLTWEGLF